jgi:S-adenosylmethionine decarboxylase proenzyme
MDHAATHVFLDGFGIDVDLLNDALGLENILKRAAEAAGCTQLGSLKHQFQPQGVSVVLMVSESHLSVHSWPERRYAAFDFFTCGKGVASDGVAEVKRLIVAERWIEQKFLRGAMNY